MTPYGLQTLGTQTLGMQTLGLQTLGLQTLDIAMLATLAVSVLVGLWRGLVFELMALAGWVVAYLGAREFAPLALRHLPEGSPTVLAVVLVFVAVMVVWSLLSRLLRMAVRATPLGCLDRLLGALFGGLRALVLLLVVASVVSMTPAGAAAAWQQSHGAAWLRAAIDGLKPWLPGEFGRYFPA